MQRPAGWLLLPPVAADTELQPVLPAASCPDVWTSPASLCLSHPCVQAYDSMGHSAYENMEATGGAPGGDQGPFGAGMQVGGGLAGAGGVLLRAGRLGCTTRCSIRRRGTTPTCFARVAMRPSSVAFFLQTPDLSTSSRVVVAQVDTEDLFREFFGGGRARGGQTGFEVRGLPPCAGVWVPPAAWPAFAGGPA